jgi:hypothetical protein
MMELDAIRLTILAAERKLLELYRAAPKGKRKARLEAALIKAHVAPGCSQ